MNTSMKRRDFLATASTAVAGTFFWQSLLNAGGGNPPPGVVIDRSSDPKNLFLGAPSMEILSDGTYVTSHDWFGPKALARTDVFVSHDVGTTWRKIAEIPNLTAGMLFYNADALWTIGWMPKSETLPHQSITICRSTDGGASWTTPLNDSSGVLLSDREYFCDPAPVLIHQGRVWKEVECYGQMESKKRNWATRLMPLMMSAPVDADLLNRDSWTFSNPVAWPTAPSRHAIHGERPDWNVCWEAEFDHEKLGGWLEGNALYDPDGNMLILMRVDDPICDGKAARLNLSKDFKTLSFDPATGFVSMPGGCKKFVIRFDDVSKRYWSLVDWVHPEDADAPDKERTRNTLALVASDDLRSWEVRSIIYRHSNRKIGFQYVDWRTVGNDIHFVCRLAWDESPNCHDSNYLTFDRIVNFRTRTRQDDDAPFA